MSLKGTHKILEKKVGLSPISAPGSDKRSRRNVRNIMLVISLILGLIVTTALSIFTKEFDISSFASILIICIPSLYHKFVIPEKTHLKHYFQVAAIYVTVWGLPVVLLLENYYFSRPLTIAYAVVFALLWLLGAFLPSWL